MVIISNQVLDRIDDYAISLTYYPISIDRAIEKVEKLKNTLLSIDTFIKRLPLCTYKDLGQRYNVNKKPIFLNLRRFNYEDESGFQWAFACLCDTDTNNVYITKMMPSNQIKEAITQFTKPILEFWDRISKI